VLTVGEVVLDPATRCVSYTGRPLELTAREFAVLEYLVRRAGDVVTRTELLDHVWDENFAGSTNVVDVYVGYLRKKLGGDGSAAPIRTVRGVGFVLEA
jgi:DNA-binding response OmpR family regulator